jgi:hypothetical protein
MPDMAGDIMYNVFFHEPFCGGSLNRAVLEQNRSIKTVLETVLCHLVCNVNYLAWPDPSPTPVQKVAAMNEPQIQFNSRQSGNTLANSC